MTAHRTVPERMVASFLGLMADHRYLGRKSDGLGSCSCGELVWECDHAKHVSDAQQDERETFGWCDLCDRRVLRDSLYHYPEGNVCEGCYEKASY